MKQIRLRELATVIAGDSPRDGIIALQNESRPGQWLNAASQLIAWYDSKGESQATVFQKGNAKLPFWSFSTLPVATCPGAGDCVAYCYSFKSWCHPFAYTRQARLTVALGTDWGRAWIAREFAKLPVGATVRLYVDGDIDSPATLNYWSGLVSTRPDLKVYGYTKSLHIVRAYLEAGGIIPRNWLLNLSSGHRFDAETEQAVLAFDSLRGTFTAIDMPREHTKADLAAAGRERFGRAVFVCPGACGSCTLKGHACGSERFRKVPIVIATH